MKPWLPVATQARVHPIPPLVGIALAAEACASLGKSIRCVSLSISGTRLHAEPRLHKYSIQSGRIPKGLQEAEAAAGQ